MTNSLLRDGEGEVVALDLGDDFGDGGAEVVGAGSAMGVDGAGGVDAIGAVVDVTLAEVGAGGFVHFEVEMGEVFAIGIADVADVLATHDGFVEGNGDGLEVGIHRLHDAAVGEAVGHEEDFPPSGIRFARIDDEAVADGVDGVTEVGVHPADAIEVVAGVASTALVVHFPKGLRVVGECAVGGSDGIVEATGERDAEAVDTGEHFEAMVEGRDEPAVFEFAGLAVGSIGFLGGAETTDATAFGFLLPPDGVGEKGDREDYDCDGDAVLELHRLPKSR